MCFLWLRYDLHKKNYWLKTTEDFFHEVASLRMDIEGLNDDPGATQHVYYGTVQRRSRGLSSLGACYGREDSADASDKGYGVREMKEIFFANSPKRSPATLRVGGGLS